MNSETHKVISAFEEEEEEIKCGICEKKLEDTINCDYNDDIGEFCCKEPNCLRKFWGVEEEEEEEEEPICCVGCGKDGVFPKNRDGDTMCESCHSDGEEEEDKEYTIEIPVVGLGYCRYYDKEDRDKYVVYCKNAVWKMKGDKTARDMEGNYCETESEEEE